jgi:uncharacterized protein YbjT (DUF2867 family)
MKASKRVLVLGGNGFIGRSIVAKLQLQGAQVVVSSRKTAKQANQMQVNMQNMQQANDWLSVINSFDAVVNSVGILRERKNESYTDIHTFAVESLADACAQLGVKLVQISVIGLTDNAKSGFITSKYWGEQAILASGANAIIVRPSLLDGQGGYGAKWFRRVASWPLQLVMKSKGLVAPLQVTDLGEAVANLCFTNEKMPPIIELGGNDMMTIPQYLAKLREINLQKPALQLYAPKFVVRLASHIFDLFAWTPLSFGHFELMQGYNVPAQNMLPELLGRMPTGRGELNIKRTPFHLHAITV